VLSTCADLTQAAALARTLVDEQLAACVNLVANARSVYRWQGKIEDASECLLVIKTTRDAYPALARRLAQIHPYEVPEILAVDVVEGGAGYLAWLGESVRRPP